MFCSIRAAVALMQPCMCMQGFKLFLRLEAFQAPCRIPGNGRAWGEGRSPKPNIDQRSIVGDAHPSGATESRDNKIDSGKAWPASSRACSIRRMKKMGEYLNDLDRI